ncbi:MAG: efflux RND transporter periplasmic adaptor subunit [Tabrizicola sp.]|uniref:efflux RND transporter periplasmic adaptor subunit n=1 Tax=Tabrizicola sp. TaxID=2005166 RepID=UPI002735B91D|nr:efflux RND transporter periplasmic adaptor subunit [Tabrizicola sp.]MDP3263454.1 efflux RND transporter periplasmic adaptor subunit [Tabrizicola sp.]MDP3646811.1 efflux RND transporter periplasmic adaptor subunit [Paracoccaceae bacterium]
MRLVPQLGIVALIALVAIPLSARFVPGTRPWFDQVGLLQPLAMTGIVPGEAADDQGTPAGAPAGGPAAGRGVQVVAVALQKVALRDVVSAIGSARGVQSVDLSFEITGRLAAIRVAPGSLVAAGDVIADLDAESAQLQVDRARLVLEDAQRTVDRLQQLSQSGTATALQRQEAELALRTAQLGLQSAERDLANHRLLAPVAGYVGLVAPQVGDLLSPTTPVTRIEDRSSLIVEFRVPERLAALVAVGDPVQATAISTADQVIEGRIVAVDNRVDEASRTLRVEATIGNAEDRLRAGMAFQINLVFTGQAYPAVDPMAIQWGGDGAFVWVVREGKANRLPIRILQRNADTVLVDAAFEPGDMVVTEGVQPLRPGADVSIAAPRS